MIYAVKMEAGIANCFKKYFLVEEYSGSKVLVQNYNLIDMMKKQPTLVCNLRLINNSIELKNWPQSIRIIRGGMENGCEYILISVSGPNMFNLLDTNGVEIWMTLDQLVKRVKRHEIANCNWNEQIQKIEYMDLKFREVDLKFKSNIEDKYSRFLDKQMILGLRMGFRYHIQNRIVILDTYKGDSKTVVVPDFVTIINKWAFKDKIIKSVKLGKSVEIIGEEAFLNCKLKSIDIPAGVRYIGKHAFYNSSSSLITSLKIANKNTVEVDNYDIGE